MQAMARQFFDELYTMDSSVLTNHVLHLVEPKVTHEMNEGLCKAFIGLDLPLTPLVDVVERKRKILTCTQTKQNHTKQKIEQLRSTRLIHHDPKATNSRHGKASSEITDSGLPAPTTNYF
jgi:hypothetical protein